MSKTLFEGPVNGDGHAIKAANDTEVRRCDGTNNGAHPAPGPTPTSVSVDAMQIVGEDFGGKWYPGFDDYFIERFGPDGQNEDNYWYWGILVNETFTSVGGCQFQVAAGDRVLWAYDAFNGRPFLRLTANATTVDVGQPLSVGVEKSSGGIDGTPQDAGPAGGVSVAPVTTASNGFQTVNTGDSSAVTTAANGSASITWSTPGWHRIKASADGFVRSNRLDVCVRATPTSDCGPAPADTQVRQTAVLPPELPPDPPKQPDPGPPGNPNPPTDPQPPGKQPEPPANVAAVKLDAPRFVGNGDRSGRVVVGWNVLDAGVGVRSWLLESRAAGSKGAWTRRATGTTATTAPLRLPIGTTSDVRFTLVDNLARSGTTTVGRTVVPIDDRSLGLRKGWTRASDAGAWRGTVTRGVKGAAFSVALAAGRPTFVVRTGRSPATVELRVGRRAETFRIPAAKTSATRLVTGSKRTTKGSVAFRVVSGTVSVDGAAVQP